MIESWLFSRKYFWKRWFKGYFKSFYFNLLKFTPDPGILLQTLDLPAGSLKFTPWPWDFTPYTRPTCRILKVYSKPWDFTLNPPYLRDLISITSNAHSHCRRYSAKFLAYYDLNHIHNIILSKTFFDKSFRII